jgi:hypothetical protein
MKLNTTTVVIGAAVLVAAFLAWQWTRNRAAPVGAVTAGADAAALGGKDLPQITEATPTGATTNPPRARTPVDRPSPPARRA